LRFSSPSSSSSQDSEQCVRRIQSVTFISSEWRIPSLNLSLSPQ
jgi:hypothetical protein